MEKDKEKQKKMKKMLSDFLLTLIVQIAVTAIGIFLKFYFNATDHLISQIYILGILIISLKTDGYLWGVVTSLADVAIINFVFTPPFMGWNFSSETIPSALVSLAIALASTTLTTKVHESERIKLEGEKEKMRANLLRAVSHDIRTPLTSIYGSSSAIIDGYDDLTKEQKIQLLKDVRSDAEWLVRMVENLLSVTRVSDDTVSLAMSSVPVDELVGSVVSKFTKRREVFLQGDELRKPVVFKCDLPDHFVSVQGDAMLLGQVISNLLDNAVFHADNMTKMGLRVTDDKEHVYFEVYDDGCGIAPERLKTLFTGTYASETKKNDKGRSNMGIGLSVCYSIIKAHGGEIVAKNRPEGGASFSFSLNKDEDAEYEEDEE